MASVSKHFLLILAVFLVVFISTTITHGSRQLAEKHEVHDDDHKMAVLQDNGGAGNGGGSGSGGGKGHGYGNGSGGGEDTTEVLDEKSPWPPIWCDEDIQSP
ncbi:hypothetical protein CTI12_AA220530 [Artemisia annua]|uniref:Glycine rich protein n=1 Tax=Artemisia annua TaxID=35608 RepID=A0A2U1NWE2_ARTAN|nr:hypothetical protein CTI12_AA220530 [Artemisia annua]